MNIDFAEIIKALKELGAVRFIIIIILLTVGFFTFTFRDEVSEVFKGFFEEKRVEFREIRNLDGLEIALNGIQNKYNIPDYAVYIYQPKDFAYYKKVVLTNSRLVKSVPTLQGSYLDEQPYINKMLIDNEYILLNEEEITEETSFIHALGFKNVLIKRLMYNESIIGEIHLIFSSRPTTEDVVNIARELTPLNYIYVL